MELAIEAAVTISTALDVIKTESEPTGAEFMYAIFPHPAWPEAMRESVLDAYGRFIHI